MAVAGKTGSYRRALAGISAMGRQSGLGTPDGCPSSPDRTQAMTTLAGKTLFITGASRGIGLAIALRAARDGANIVIAAKSDVPNPKLRGTLDTPMKRFDLMQQVNARGSFLCAQACLPHLLAAPNPHILTLAPPPSLEPKWWGPHTGYTLAKMGMSFVTLGLAAEFGPQGVAVNALWPRTLIATDALNMIPGVGTANGRRPEIMADAAHAVLVRPAAGFSGRFLIDDEVLAQAGVDDLSGYAVDPSQPLLPDLFLD